MIDGFHDEVAERLRAAGQRYTANRRAIVDILTKADQPLTIPDIVEAARGMATSSAYRNVLVLDAAGVLHKIVTSDEFARYELAEDLTDHHHHHLICSICGAVEDFSLPAAFEDQAGTTLTRAARRAGYAVRAHRIDVIGVCARCGGGS